MAESHPQSTQEVPLQENIPPPPPPLNPNPPNLRNRRFGDNNPFHNPTSEFHRAILREIQLNNRNANARTYRTYLVLGIVLLILLFDNSYIFETSLIASFRFFLFSIIAILISVYLCSLIQKRSNRMRGNGFYYHQAHLQQFLSSQYPGLINTRHLQLELIDRDFNENDYEMLLALDEDIPNRSVNPELISQLPDQEVNEQELEKTTSQSCSICLEKYEVGELTKNMPCLHKFHSKCLNKWLMIKGTCPICKFSLH